MRETMPYNPELEYELPVTVSDKIYDELRYGGEGAELRKNLSLELGQIYQESRLRKSLAKLAVSSMYAGSAEKTLLDDEGIDTSQVAVDSSSYHLGSLLAIHTIAMSHPKYKARQFLLNFDIFEQGYVGLSEEQVAAVILDEYDERRDLFEMQTDEMKIALLTAADQLFEDCPPESRSEQREKFVFGYLSTGTKIYSAMSIWQRRQIVAPV